MVTVPDGRLLAPRPRTSPPTLQQKIEKTLRATAYLCTGMAGAAVFLIPAAAVDDVLGYALSGVWAAFMLTAVPAAVSALADRYRIEYIMLPFFTMAMTVVTLTTWLSAVHMGGDLAVTARAYLMTALTLSYAARFAGLHTVVRRRGGGTRWTPN